MCVRGERALLCFDSTGMIPIQSIAPSSAWGDRESHRCDQSPIPPDSYKISSVSLLLRYRCGIYLLTTLGAAQSCKSTRTPRASSSNIVLDAALTVRRSFTRHVQLSHVSRLADKLSARPEARDSVVEPGAASADATPVNWHQGHWVPMRL